MEPLFPINREQAFMKELQAFMTACEHLISSTRAGQVLSKEECEIVQLYLSEILTILKDL